MTITIMVMLVPVHIAIETGNRLAYIGIFLIFEIFYLRFYIIQGELSPFMGFFYYFMKIKKYGAKLSKKDGHSQGAAKVSPELSQN